MADTTLEITIRVNDETRQALRRANAQVAQLTRQLRGIRRASQSTQQVARNIGRISAASQRARLAVGRLFARLQTGARNSGRQLQRLRRTVGGLRTSLVAIGAVAGLTGVSAVLLRASDSALQLAARLKIVTDTKPEFDSLRNALFELSQFTRTDFLNNAKIFARLSLATEQLGTSQRDLLTVTATLNKAILLSGATAQEANAGIIQFTQGLASNRFQGDELRSVLENLVVVGDELARSLDTDIAGLRAMGEAGQLTRDILVKALLDAAERVDKRFAELPVTLGQAAQRIQNAFIFAFQGDETGPLIDALTDLGKELDKPETQQALRDLARIVATVAGGFIRAAPAIAEFGTALITVVQAAGIVIGGLIRIGERFLRRGGFVGMLFGGNRAAFLQELDGILGETNTAINLLFQDLVAAQSAAADRTIDEALLAAKRRNALEKQVTELTKKQITIRNKALRDEIRSITTEIKKAASELKELQEELVGLDAPTRSTDAFIAQTQRFADLRRAQALIEQGRLRDARKILNTLREEAAGLDDVIQKAFLQRIATEALRRVDKELIDQIKERTRFLENEKQIRQDIIDDKLLAPEVLPIIATGQDTAVITNTKEEAEKLRDELDKVAINAEFGLPTVTEEMTKIGVAAAESAAKVAELNAELARIVRFQESGALSGTTASAGDLASGGRIPGFGGGDKIPARLEKGEFVVNKRSTRRFGGLLSAINNGSRDISGFFPLRRFAEGGMVPGDVTASLMRASSVHGTGTQQTSETVVLDVRSNGAPLARVRGTRGNVIALTEYLRGFQNNIAGR